MAKPVRGRFGRFKAAAKRGGKRIRRFKGAAKAGGKRLAQRAAPSVKRGTRRIAQRAAKSQPFFIRFFVGRKSDQIVEGLLKRVGL